VAAKGATAAATGSVELTPNRQAKDANIVVFSVPPPERDASVAQTIVARLDNDTAELLGFSTSIV
jgi:hypothetical protein